MANYQELANLVWNVADDVLRGLFKPHEYGDITLPFLVLRRLDCILDEDGRKEKAINTYNAFKDKVSEEMLPPIILRAVNTSFYNTSQYDLSRLTEDPTNIRLNFENYLNGFSQDVRDIIENFNLDGFIERLDRNNRLFIFCDKFTEIDLHPDKVDNHTMGQVFEEAAPPIFRDVQRNQRGALHARGMWYSCWSRYCLRNTVKICAGKGLSAASSIRVVERAAC